MIKFAVKSGVAVGSLYYISQEGVWKNSEETTKLYGKINTAVKPYFTEVSSHLPVKIPDLPNTDKMSYLAKQYWNQGVMATFRFLANLPDTVSNLTQQGISSILENTEMKKLVDSLGGSSEANKVK